MHPEVREKVFAKLLKLRTFQYITYPYLGLFILL